MQKTLKNAKCNQEGDRILIIEGLKRIYTVRCGQHLFLASDGEKKSVFQTNLEVSQGDTPFSTIFSIIL